MSNNSENHLPKPLTKEKLDLIKKYFELNKPTNMFHVFDHEHGYWNIYEPNDFEKLKEWAVSNTLQDVEVKPTESDLILDSLPPELEHKLFFAQDEFQELFKPNDEFHHETNELIQEINFRAQRWALGSGAFHRFAYTNNRATSMFELTPEELLNQLILEPTGKIAKNTSTSFGMAEQHITDLLKERVKQAVQEKAERAEQKKNGYKNKFYKNTAKKSKPSPIMMALINKNK